MSNIISNLDWLASLITPAISAFFGAGIASVFVNYWLEEKRRKNIEKEKAIEELSDLLAEWVKSSYIGRFTNEDRWRLQTKYWKSILKLDKDVLDILIPRLANAKDAKPTNELIVLLRQKLLKLNELDLKYKDLNNWPPDKDYN